MLAPPSRKSRQPALQNHEGHVQPGNRRIKNRCRFRDLAEKRDSCCASRVHDALWACSGEHEVDRMELTPRRNHVSTEQVKKCHTKICLCS
jgi:hypothetical protein